MLGHGSVTDRKDGSRSRPQVVLDGAVASARRRYHYPARRYDTSRGLALNAYAWGDGGERAIGG
jgi:hypothetical protein